jgi:hypothetical protein
MEDFMKIVIALVPLLIFSGVASAQNPDPSKWTCRNLSESGGSQNQGETIFGDQACRPIGQTPPQAPPSGTSLSSVAPTPAQSPTPSTQSAAAASTSEQQATIYFYRPKRFQGSALKPSIFVDDTRVGSMHNGDSVKIPVTPGTHRIYSTDKSTGLDLTAKIGETYYVRIDILTGFWKGHGGVTLVDPQQGKYEVGQLAHKETDAKP